MVDRDVVLEALSAVLNASVTSVQKQSREVNNVSTAGSAGVGIQLLNWFCHPLFGVPLSKPSHQDQGAGAAVFGGATPSQLSVKDLITTVLYADETSQVSTSSFQHIQSVLTGVAQAPYLLNATPQDIPTGQNHIIDEKEFFAPEFDYDFTKLRDTKTYYRGGEEYQRPCGWFRFALKVLDKYDGNTWLGTSYRSTQSVPGEWPVSFHGTSKKGAEGIIKGYYEAGSGKAYGRGIYSTPDMAEAISYAKTFTSSKTGKTYKVILQNRINPQYRQKHRNDEKYWLIPIPAGKSDQEEREMVKRAIRPYGLLLKEV